MNSIINGKKNRKVLLLADPFSAHTIKWANGLSSRGIELMIFGLSDFDRNQYSADIKLEIFKISEHIKWKSSGSLAKVIYLLGIPRLKRVIKKYKPDIVHAHAASSYGLLGAITKFHPYIISVWGSDVYNFPLRSGFHRRILTYSLANADKILSTSNVMAKETKKYTKKDITVIPFGVDTTEFKPTKVNRYFSQDDIVIGTIKSIEKKYGTEHLVRAFKMVKDKYPDLPLKLLLVGRGSQTDYIKSLIKEFNLESDSLITGFIPYNEIPEYHNMLDIYISVSTEDSESFGVAILEASACEIPVIVSNVGGLPEVVENEKTGFIIEKENPSALAEVLSRLVTDKKMSSELGRKGREMVLREYDWEKSLNKMISVYDSIAG